MSASIATNQTILVVGGGISGMTAALEAADEIGLAVIAITLTIVAIFAPVSFMGGVAGMYFKQFGLTVAVAVLPSAISGTSSITSEPGNTPCSLP